MTALLEAGTTTETGYVRISPANIFRSIRHDLDGTWHLHPANPDPVVFPDQASAEAAMAAGELVQEVRLELPEGGFYQATVSGPASATAAAFTTFAGAYRYLAGFGSVRDGDIVVMEPQSSPVSANSADGETVFLGHAVAWVPKPIARCLTFTRP